MDPKTPLASYSISEAPSQGTHPAKPSPSVLPPLQVPQNQRSPGTHLRPLPIQPQAHAGFPPKLGVEVGASSSPMGLAVMRQVTSPFPKVRSE